jgi:hypothetical protein
MAKKTVMLSIVILIPILLILAACTNYTTPADSQSKVVPVEPKANVTVQKNVTTVNKTTTQTKTPAAIPTNDIKITPVPETQKYTATEPTETSVKKDTCGCSLTWDPVCSNGKTYINRCLLKCFGGSFDTITTSAQCPRKDSPVKVYADDNVIEYESDKWNSGYCWRDMYRDAGIRYCRNLIVNGRVNTEPSPLNGNWLDESHLSMDKEGRTDSYTIKLGPGEQALNEEYNMTFQPLFETGRYRFSFWARQDAASNIDWKVKLTLRDWWEKKPMPVGVKGCYKLMTEINAEEVYMEEQKPNAWKHYHYEFDVPLNNTQWESQQRLSSECEYEWDKMPHGYRIELTGPSFGDAYFDDFSLQKVE